MPSLEIHPSETALPYAVIPPRAGSSPSEWAAYRATARAAGVYRVAMATARQSGEDMPPANPRWAPIPRRLFKLKTPAPIPVQKPTRAERMASLVRDTANDGDPSIRFIQSVCCAFYDVTRIDLISGRRTLDIIRPRHVGIYFACELTTHSLATISSHFGDRDHTTILHAHRKILAKLAGDSTLLAEVNEIGDAIMGGGEA